MDDEELTRLATKELEKEAKRAAERVETMGPSGWRRATSKHINKRFLISTLRDCASTNHRITSMENGKKHKDREKEYRDRGRESKSSNDGKYSKEGELDKRNYYKNKYFAALAYYNAFNNTEKTDRKNSSERSSRSSNHRKETKRRSRSEMKESEKRHSRDHEKSKSKSPPEKKRRKK